MGRHSFESVWAAPPQYRSRRPAAIAIAVASALVVLAVFGIVWLNNSPSDPPSSAGATTAAATTETAETTTSDPLTALGPASPVVLPVTVLNNSPVNGLAARIAAVLEASGWPIKELLNYNESQVPATTAFFTAGDAGEEAAARAMVAQFPQISGGAQPRFEGLNGAGLTLAAIGDWVP